MLDFEARRVGPHPYRRTAVPEHQERTALGYAHGAARVAAEPCDRDAPPVISLLDCSQQDGAPAKPLHDDRLTALHTYGVVGQVVAKLSDADADRHTLTLGWQLAEVNRIAWGLCMRSVVIAW